MWCCRSNFRRELHRGAVLFEVLLSVALFGGAAAFTLAAMQSVFDSLDRLRSRQEAIDLASSKLAELEAGLISLADLRSGNAADSDERWVFDLHSRRSEFTRLTLVELTVRQRESGGGAGAATPVSFTLRQLIALRQSDDAGSAGSGGEP